MRGVLVRWAVLTASIAVAARLIDAVHVDGGFWGHVWVAAILGLVNAVVRPVLILLTLPITILTLGAFLLVVNALSLGLVDWLSSTLDIDGFSWTLLAALVISVVAWVLEAAIGRD
ncbi:phage holin family protein [Actinomarinicola tropica]|uniref:phage holin family protein n=1 Tax=Actinomarinicola tropica TaxID=2789776 RepID=UPI0018971C89|nr:phage holin family protein [Actinomarinicola tropica]